MADLGTNSKGYKLQGKTKVAVDPKTVGAMRQAITDFKAQHKLEGDPIAAAGTSMYLHGLRPDVRDVDLYMPGLPKPHLMSEHEGYEVDAHDSWDLKDHGAKPGLTKRVEQGAVPLHGMQAMAPAQLLETYQTLNRPKDQASIKLLQEHMKKTAKAKPKVVTPSMYEKMKGEAPVPVLEGDEKHPLAPIGGAYFPGGAPWLMRKAHAEANLPKDSFIFSGGPDRRIQGKGLTIGDVDVSPEAVMAHEVGHARDKLEGGLAGKVLQTPLVRALSSGVGTGGGAYLGALTGKALEDKPIIGIPASMAVGALTAGLGQAPTLVSERRATKGGLESLRGAGASEEEMKQYEKELGSAYGSYRRGALINAAMAGGAAPLIAKFGAAKPTGFYKGEPTSPHTVKFKTEYQGIPINIDRPKGFIMKGTDARGRDWARRYKYNYGFIPKTLGGDGDGLDVFIGPLKKEQYAYWAVQRNDDGSFDEYKVFLGFPDRDAAVAAYRQHIPKKYFKGIITMKIEMMKAMLGKVNPDEKMKRASALSMLDELGWIMGTST